MLNRGHAGAIACGNVRAKPWQENTDVKHTQWISKYRNNSDECARSELSTPALKWSIS